MNKIIYSVGYTSIILCGVCIAAHTQFIYTEKFLLDPKLMGMIWFFYSTLNSIIQPTVGYLSDNTNLTLFNSKR
jgi:hypothetical protein